MKLNPKVTKRKVLAAVDSGESEGFCAACGAEAYGVEPDARKYKCAGCGQFWVYGAEELAMVMFA